MACVTKDIGPRSTLVLLAAFLTTAHAAGTVTWPQCNRPLPVTIPRGANDSEAFILQVNRCNINEIIHDDLRGLPGLEFIDFDHNNLHHIDAAVFRDNSQILHLHLSHNKLNAIPNFGAKFVLPVMILLDLTHNEITKLDNPNVFTSTKKLKWLMLDNNKIEYVHPDMFTGLKQLATVSLNNNKLTHILDKTFAVSTLTFVDLSYNYIEIVEPEAFAGTQLKTLNLEGNKLTHLPENFINKIGASLTQFCYHRNPWNCEYILKQINIFETKCDGQSNFFNGDEAICKVTSVV